jgi:hypothetical protein
MDPAAVAAPTHRGDEEAGNKHQQGYQIPQRAYVCISPRTGATVFLLEPARVFASVARPKKMRHRGRWIS